MWHQLKAGFSLDAETRIKILLLVQGFGFIAWSLILRSLGLSSEVDILRWMVALSSLAVFGYFLTHKEQSPLKYHLLSAVLALANVTCLCAIYRSGAHPITLLGGMLVVNVSLIFFNSHRWAISIILLWAFCLPTILFNTPQTLPASMILICYSFALVAGYFAFVGQYEGVQQLLKSQEISKELMSHMVEGVVLHDRDTKVIYANETASRIFGFNNSQVVGKSNFDPQWKVYDHEGNVCPPEKHPSFIARETRRPVLQVPLRLENKFGDVVFLSVTAIPLECSSETFPQVLVTLQDVTPQVLNDRKIAEQNIMLQHAAKLNALAEMASGIAHEINNPLAIINGRIIQLKDSYSSDLETIKVLDNMEKNVWRISDIIRSMKTIVDESSVVSSKIEVSSIVARVVDIFQTNLREKNVRLDIEIPQNTFVLGIESQVAQVLFNVIQNAADAVAGAATPWIRIELQEQSDMVVISVKNSGEISQDVLRKIGQPFFTTKEVGKGKGLSVSVSKTLLKKMRGTLELASQSGETSCEISLPKFAG